MDFQWTSVAGSVQCSTSGYVDGFDETSQRQAFRNDVNFDVVLAERHTEDAPAGMLRGDLDAAASRASDTWHGVDCISHR